MEHCALASPPQGSAALCTPAGCVGLAHEDRPETAGVHSRNCAAGRRYPYPSSRQDPDCREWSLSLRGLSGNPCQLCGAAPDTGLLGVVPLCVGGRLAWEARAPLGLNNAKRSGWPGSEGETSAGSGGRGEARKALAGATRAGRCLSCQLSSGNDLEYQEGLPLPSPACLWVVSGGARWALSGACVSPGWALSSSCWAGNEAPGWGEPHTKGPPSLLWKDNTSCACLLPLSPPGSLPSQPPPPFLIS